MKNMTIKFDEHEDIKLKDIGMVHRTDDVLTVTVHENSETYVFNMEFILYYIVENIYP